MTDRLTDLDTQYLGASMPLPRSVVCLNISRRDWRSKSHPQTIRLWCSMSDRAGIYGVTATWLNLRNGDTLKFMYASGDDAVNPVTRWCCLITVSGAITGIWCNLRIWPALSSLDQIYMLLNYWVKNKQELVWKGHRSSSLILLSTLDVILTLHSDDWHRNPSWDHAELLRHGLNPKSSCIIQAARWTLLTKRFMKVHFLQNCGNTISSWRDMQGCLLSHMWQLAAGLRLCHVFINRDHSLDRSGRASDPNLPRRLEDKFIIKQLLPVYLVCHLGTKRRQT